MDSETMKHLFEPFFTTKPVGKGSGLGLAMVYGIVKQSGGYIWAYSEPGMGSTLKLYFPAADTPVTDAATPAWNCRLTKPAERFWWLRTIRWCAGWPVVRWSKPGSRCGRPPMGRTRSSWRPESHGDAVLTDLAMPVIGGRELARQLQALQPGLPVIFMSGYTDDEVVRRGLLERGVPFWRSRSRPSCWPGRCEK